MAIEKIEFKLIDGRASYHVIDGNENDIFLPSENPFGLGCCDCGLYHDVEYRINNDHIGLTFIKNTKETIRLREFIKNNHDQFPGNSLKIIAEMSETIDGLKYRVRKEKAGREAAEKEIEILRAELRDANIERGLKC